MVSSFGQPELTVTVIAMGCHMVRNPASHLVEGIRENARSLSTKGKINTTTSNTPSGEMTRLFWQTGHCMPITMTLIWETAQSTACTSSLELTSVPITHRPGHTSVSFLSTGSQLASERQSSLWSEPKSSASLLSDSFRHVWRKSKDVAVNFTAEDTASCVSYTVPRAVQAWMHLTLPIFQMKKLSHRKS